MRFDCTQHETHHESNATVRERALAIALSTLLAIIPLNLTWLAPCALGQTLEEAEATAAATALTLDEAKAKLDQISEEYKTISSEAEQIQQEVDILANRVLSAQEAMLQGRSSLSNTAVYEYRNNIFSTVINVIFGAQDWSTLTKSMDYVDQIIDFQTQEVASQRQLRDDLTEASNKLTEQKNVHVQKLEELDNKRMEATEVVEAAQRAADASEEAVSELKRQAEEMIWKSSNQTPVEEPEDDNADTMGREDAVSSNSPVIPDPVVEVPADSPSASNSYLTGVASAYGGSSDPYTPNPGTTATGAVCNDNSMGVAIPMSMPGYRSYFGRTVEIKYNGMTVYATVNDCGNLRGGARALDLQPGVFKAFGFPTCQAWGVRTVTYRFL